MVVNLLQKSGVNQGGNSQNIGFFDGKSPIFAQNLDAIKPK
jgi:hypothetical protein